MSTILAFAEEEVLSWRRLITAVVLRVLLLPCSSVLWISGSGDGGTLLSSFGGWMMMSCGESWRLGVAGGWKKR